MIKVNGEITFTLDFEIKIEESEDQWESLSDRERMEIVMEHLDRSDYNNMQPDDLSVWDLEELDEEAS